MSGARFACCQRPSWSSQVDAATGGQDVVGDRARGLNGQLEARQRRLSDDGGRGAVEHDGHVAALGVVHLAQHEVAGLGRRLPVDVVERLAGLVRSDATELGRPEAGDAAGSEAAARAEVGEECARR